MTSWTDLLDTTLQANKPGTQAVFRALRDNVLAFAEKATGAPVLANGYVAQAILKTTTQSGNQLLTQGASGSYTLAGGTYSWWTAGGVSPGISFGNSNVAAGVIGIVNNDPSNSKTFYLDERYVQSSPPYTDGPHFAFLAVDASGKPVHTWFANDPPWANHGPTNLQPQIYRNGRAYRMHRTVNGQPLQAALRDSAIARSLLDGSVAMTEQEVEITLAYKDSDKPIVPHPFLGANLAGLTVVMFEPGTSLMARFAEICDAGDARELRRMALDDWLAIDNTPIPYPGAPPGVAIHSARLK